MMDQSSVYVHPTSRHRAVAPVKRRLVVGICLRVPVRRQSWIDGRRDSVREREELLLDEVQLLLWRRQVLDSIFGGKCLLVIPPE